MSIRELLNEKNMSVYRLAKMSDVPYATVNDLCNGKTKLEKCSAETVYRLSKAIGIPMETLLAPCMIKRPDFENFKSAVCHQVKEKGDINFIIDTLESGNIRTYYDRKWFPESLYLLAMLDYLSRENDIPICDEYDDLRDCRLEKTIFPASLLAMSAASEDRKTLEQASASAIPEFRRFNIIESEIRNVV